MKSGGNFAMMREDIETGPNLISPLINTNPAYAYLLFIKKIIIWIPASDYLVRDASGHFWTLGWLQNTISGVSHTHTHTHTHTSNTWGTRWASAVMEKEYESGRRWQKRATEPKLESGFILNGFKQTLNWICLSWVINWHLKCLDFIFDWIRITLTDFKDQTLVRVVSQRERSYSPTPMNFTQIKVGDICWNADHVNNIWLYLQLSPVFYCCVVSWRDLGWWTEQKLIGVS